MSLTMKMLAVSVLVIAMVTLTGAAPGTVPPFPEETTHESFVADEKDALEREISQAEHEEVTVEPGRGSEEEGGEAGSTAEDGKHKIAKRATSCPCGWSLYKRSCYRYFTKPKTWAEAQKHCQTMNADLASVQSRNEENWMKRLAGSKAAWIGLSDAQQERFWFWINGGRSTYRNWCRRQPDNAGRRQHCVQFNWSGGKCWDDSICLKRKGYICEHR